MGDKYIPCGQEKLSKLEAIVQSIELWKWLAEDGSRIKEAWPGWRKRGYAKSLCPLCEYESQRQEAGLIYEACGYCPYNKHFGHCCDINSPYHAWENSGSDDKRIKYAGWFLEQLRRLKDACHE